MYKPEALRGVNEKTCLYEELNARHILSRKCNSLEASDINRQAMCIEKYQNSLKQW